MAVYRNKASQKLAVYAYDSTDGTPKTGDAANITAQISLDGGACAPTTDVNPTELDATDAPGVYIFDLTQAETNADLVIVAAVSATANILLDPAIIYTEPEQRSADVTALGGAAQSATDLKHFADSGYDPATSKVEGVKLVDTTTVNSDMRGTDGAVVPADLSTLATAASLATAQADLDTLTGVDGATLATSQPNYAPSTHSAADVWSVATRSLTTFGSLVSDIVAAVWGAVSRTLTSAANITSTGGTTVPQTGDSFARLGAPTGASVSADVAAVKAETAAILEDTGTTVPGLIAALNDLDAAAVQTAVNAALVALHLDHLLAVTYDPASKPGAADALLNELVESDGGVARFTANALEMAPTGGAGEGAVEFTYTLTDSVTGHPIDDALVEIFTDQTTTNKVAQRRTDAFGKAVFHLDAGTYYLVASKSGYMFDNPQTITVAP